MLDELRAYRRRGVFPKNRDFRDRMMPYFVDDDGTRCAVAHLLEVGGATALVARIASERNNAFVRELADEPELLAWLEAAGSSVEEAARIQPSYCDVNAASICSSEGASAPRASGVLEVTVLGSDRSSQSSATRVDAVYGDVGTIAVGTNLTTSGVHPTGTKRLVPLYAPESSSAVARDGVSAATLPGFEIRDDQLAGDHAVSKTDLTEALRSNSADCKARLAAIDPWWSERSERLCGEQGCSAAAAAPSEAASAQILVAIVGYLGMRRMTRR
ncbi:MAG: hypothetical protein KF819_33750 [Labilithrix sp.]|nr:hypothetical protein [Labilithrix sp.]